MEGLKGLPDADLSVRPEATLVAQRATLASQEATVPSAVMYLLKADLL